MAARVHHAARRCGGVVADCGAGAAALNSGDRVLGRDRTVRTQPVSAHFAEACTRPATPKGRMSRSNTVGPRLKLID